MKKCKGRRDPVNPPPVWIGVAPRDQLVAGTGDISGHVVNKQVNDDEEDKPDSSDAHEIPGKGFKSTSCRAWAITFCKTHISSPITRSLLTKLIRLLHHSTA